MQRGKVIGALVLAAAIGLVLVQQIGGPDGDGDAGVGAPGVAASPSLAQVTVAASVRLPAGGEIWRYAVDAAQSEVYWRIYKAGAAARFGHNHVISIGDLDGDIRLGSELAGAEWSLHFPVGALVIDDPGIRARYGEDFASVPSDGDKEGTRSNMLTPDVLNGEVFPEIRLSGRGVNGSLAAADLPLTIEMLGRKISLSFPASLAISPEAIVITGEHRLTHADLGMTPFTALGGLMSVGEEIDFSYRIHAVAVGR